MTRDGWPFRTLPKKLYAGTDMICCVMVSGEFDAIADFRFIRLLGSGSFAHTYLAERDGERFAVKVFNDLPAKPSARARFAREVAALRIQHPNLAEYVA